MINRTFVFSLLLILAVLSGAVFAVNPADSDPDDADSAGMGEDASLSLPSDKKPQPAEQAVVRKSMTQGLPDSMLEFMVNKKIPPEDISVFVQDVAADGPLLQHEIDVPRNPASTMKLLTTWSAIKVLGPAYTWDTEAWIRGEVTDGVLNGDLILKGYGDPFLVYESFWQFVHDLRLKGLKEIRGDVIIDNSFYSIPDIDPAAFDGEGSRLYNAQPSALMFNFQATRLLLDPDVANKKVNITLFPMPPSVRVDNQMKLIKGRCGKWSYRPDVKQAGDVITVRGNYAEACGQQFAMSVMSEADELVFNAFREFWEMLGGRIDGRFRRGAVQSADTRFHVHTSPALGEQVRLINKWSNNVMTRQLLLSVGAKMFGQPATLEKGRLAVLKVLSDQGVATDGVVVENGSGLSRDARVSVGQLGQLLQVIWRDPYMPEMLNSLPLLGEDGTLARRFRRSDLKSRGRMKTGTLKQVSALAGYMLTRTGKRMVVVVVQNGKKADGYGHALQNQLLEWVFEQ